MYFIIIIISNACATAMSRLILRNAKAIETIARTRSQRRRKEIAKQASKDLVNAFSEGALNVVKGKVPLSKKRYNSLKRYKKQLETLSSRRSSLKSRKAVLQRGGFLGLLASVLVPTIASLITATVSRR